MFRTIKMKSPISLVELEKFAEELEVEKLLKQFKNPFISGEFLSEKKNKSNFLEKEDRFILEMLIPGFNKEDIEISLDDFKITVKTKKEEENEIEQNSDYTLKEFEINSFERTYSLPKNSDLENIESKYKNGILKIEILKIKKKNKKEKTIKIID
jgi:HSP20 family protein